MQWTDEHPGCRKSRVKSGGLFKHGGIELDEGVQCRTTLVVGEYPIKIGLHQLNAG